MGKFSLRMDQETQVYLMINPDLIGRAALWKKKYRLFFLCLFLGLCGVVINKRIEMLVFYFHILVFQ